MAVLGFEPSWAGPGFRSVIGKGPQTFKTSAGAREGKNPHLRPPPCMVDMGTVLWINTVSLLGSAVRKDKHDHSVCSWEGNWLLLLRGRWVHMGCGGSWAWLPRGPAGFGPPHGPRAPPATRAWLSARVITPYVITLTLFTRVGRNRLLWGSDSQRGSKEAQPRPA